jgi:hypothetical protein
MVTDENGHPIDYLEIDVELRDKMVSHIQNRIVRNLEANKQFLQIPIYEDICAGLFTYAVEEYGKLLYLKSFSPYSPGSNKISFPYKMANKTGFLNHYKKFGLALEVLPETCKNLSTGGFTDTGFMQTGFTTPLIANFEARKRVFFADFTQDKNSIEMPPQVDRASLEKAVDEFLSRMRNEISSS